MQFKAEQFDALRYQITNSPQLAVTGPGVIANRESQTMSDLGINMCEHA